jgi:hypothetical protein
MLLRNADLRSQFTLRRDQNGLRSTSGMSLLHAGRRDHEADGFGLLLPHGARFAVAQDAQRDDPCLATTRNAGNIG